MAMKTFSEIEKLILSKHTVIKKNGIAFLLPILEKLGNPHKNLGKVIHVTGTNGKGSTAYIMESVLRNAGFKTALYTSPHVSSLRERIRFMGGDIPERDFARIFGRVYSHCRELSFFEIMTIVAFCYFSEKKPDFSVIEVGIGGKFDTTNVIEKKELCFITSLDYDHKDLLGGTLEEIAAQKAGIIKKGSVCVCPIFAPSLRRVIKKTAAEAGGKVVFIDDFFKIEKADLGGNFMLVKDTETGERYKLAILGSRQTLNLSMVKKGLGVLAADGVRLKPSAFKRGLEKVRINARFQVIVRRVHGRKKFFIMDGAHNEEAMRTLLETLDYLGIKKTCFVFSMLNTKDYRKNLKILSQKAEEIIFTSLDSEKAIDPHILADEYQKINPKAGVEVSQGIREAIFSAARSSDHVCVCGSFYLASEALKILRDLRGKP